MGGSAGNIVNKLNPVNAVQGIIKNPVQGIIGAAGGGLLGGAAMGPAGALLGGSFGANSFSPQSQPGPSAIPGPFTLDPVQYAKDQADINNLGQSQYQQTLTGIDANTAAQNQAASNFFQQSLPNIAENAQAAHLYDSTGYGQEVARQQAALANQVSSQAAQEKLQAIGGLQGMQTGALQRGQSLEDFVNQANVAKTIGAQLAPPPPNGKQNFGTVASGIGALSPFARLGKAGGGAAAAGGGAAAGAIPALAGDVLPLA